MAESDEEIEDDPPSDERVARRALILSAVVCRGNIDHGAGNDEAESLRSRMLDWVQSLELLDEIEPRELALLQAPLGTLAEWQVISTTWQAEGLAILGWALNCLDLPQHAEKVDPYAATDALSFLSMDAVKDVRSPGLRLLLEIRALRETYYHIHVALRDFERHRRPTNFARWVDPADLSRLGLSIDELTAEGDLQIGGQPLRLVPDEKRQVCEWIMRERHRAAIWLVGEEAVYSEVTADT